VSIDGAANKLGQVVSAAMRSDQALHLRLAGCICDLGVLAIPMDDNFPPDLKERFDAIMTACTREPDPMGSLGTAVVTASKMDFGEVCQWLDKIHSLYVDVLAREQRERIAQEIMAVRS
jgi:hypothetical protein